jgi:hypothetical protein
MTSNVSMKIRNNSYLNLTYGQLNYIGIPFFADTNEYFKKLAINSICSDDELKYNVMLPEFSTIFS